MSRTIVDMHQHVPPADELDERVEACRNANIVKAVLLGLPPTHEPDDNDAVLAAAGEYPDLFVPFFGVAMDAMTPDDLTRSRDRGFVGLKFIAPTKAYNDTSYFPLYERAAQLKLPALFHLGIVANKDRWSTCDSNLMRAIHLDHIARCIPELTVIGAHFGNPWSDEAAMACRWDPNLFFDLSGSLLKYRPPSFLGDLLWWRPDGPYASPDGSHAWSKIVFGSDVASASIAEVVADYEKLMSTLELDARLQASVWHGTAERLLGLG